MVFGMFTIVEVLIICAFSGAVSNKQQAQDLEEDGQCVPTTPDVLGPYYYPHPPMRRHICDRDPAFRAWNHLLVEGQALDENCKPLINAKIEVWQADHSGHYLFKANCRGTLITGKSGHYAFLTIHPGKYSTDPTRKLFRPAHIHLRVLHPGYDILVTQMYFKGDSNLGPKDSCSACSSDHSDLVVEPETICSDDTDTHCFDIAHFDLVLKKGHGVDVVQDDGDALVELLDVADVGK